MFVLFQYANGARLQVDLLSRFKPELIVFHFFSIGEPRVMNISEEFPNKSGDLPCKFTTDMNTKISIT